MRYVGATRSLRTSIGLTLTGIEPLPRTLPDDAIVVVAGNVDTFIDGTGASDADDASRRRRSSTGCARRYVPGHRLVTICSGALLAARAGLLDGYACTTHYLELRASLRRSRRRPRCSTTASTSRIASA